MRALARWAIAILVSAAAFAGAWYACQHWGGLDAGTSSAIAGFVAAVVLAVGAWWATRDHTAAPISATGSDMAVSVGDHSPAIAHNAGVFIIGPHSPVTVTGPSGPPRPAPQHRADGPVITGDVPQRPAAFQSRDGMLASLRQPSTGRGVSIIYAVTGMRGTGKTQLAAAAARQAITDMWRLVAWIDASTPATTLDGLAATAAAVGITPGDEQPATVLALRHWLEADGRDCMLVFDNADSPDTLRPYLPAAGSPAS